MYCCVNTVDLEELVIVMRVNRVTSVLSRKGAQAVRLFTALGAPDICDASLPERSEFQEVADARGVKEGGSPQGDGRRPNWWC